MDGTNTVMVLEEKVVNIPRKKAVLPPPQPEVRTAPPTIPPQPQQPQKRSAATELQILAMMMALSRILAPRLAVFLSMVGAFILGIMAVNQPETMRLVAAGLYDILVFIPILIYGVGKKE